MMQKLTESQKSALVWLHRHGAEGVFTGRGAEFLAAGETATFARKTWTDLIRAGLVLRPAATPKRMKLTGTGRAEAERIEDAIQAKPHSKIAQVAAFAAARSARQAGAGAEEAA